MNRAGLNLLFDDWFLVTGAQPLTLGIAAYDPITGDLLRVVGDEQLLFGAGQWRDLGPTGLAGAINDLVFDGQRIIALVEVPGDNTRTDTFAFDGSGWSLLIADGPPLLTGVFHEVAGLPSGALWYGGGDTWSWDGAAWTQLDPPTSPTVGTRFSVMRFDAALDAAVLYGGLSPNSFQTFAFMNDDWVDITTELVPPYNRAGAAWTAPVSGRVQLTPRNGALADFVLEDTGWIPLPEPTPRPPTRTRIALATSTLEVFADAQETWTRAHGLGLHPGQRLEVDLTSLDDATVTELEVTWRAGADGGAQLDAWEGGRWVTHDDRAGAGLDSLEGFAALLEGDALDRVMSPGGRAHFSLRTRDPQSAGYLSVATDSVEVRARYTR
jgi:hypothetical protein